mmetsp:Transcript_25036/g.69892  ORF Transcript_25036/g.69892 Transcript_25036/m.69892 type:complete len:318 (-) Transcript_25036:674-1627(-)
MEALKRRRTTAVGLEGEHLGRCSRGVGQEGQLPGGVGPQPAARGGGEHSLQRERGHATEAALHARHKADKAADILQEKGVAVPKAAGNNLPVKPRGGLHQGLHCHIHLVVGVGRRGGVHGGGGVGGGPLLAKRGREEGVNAVGVVWGGGAAGGGAHDGHQLPHSGLVQCGELAQDGEKGGLGGGAGRPQLLHDPSQVGLGGRHGGGQGGGVHHSLGQAQVPVAEEGQEGEEPLRGAGGERAHSSSCGLVGAWQVGGVPVKLEQKAGAKLRVELQRDGLTAEELAALGEKLQTLWNSLEVSRLEEGERDKEPLLRGEL